MFAVSLVVMLLVVAGMAIGVMNGRAPIAGSCGGLNASGKCGLCSGADQCKKKLQRSLSNDEA